MAVSRGIRRDVRFSKGMGVEVVMDLESDRKSLFGIWWLNPSLVVTSTFLNAWEIALPLGKVNQEAAMRAQGVSRVSRYFRVSEQGENAQGLLEKLEMSIRKN